MELSYTEQKLFESDTRELVLTSHRLRFTSGPASRREVVSLPLEHVTSCRLVDSSRPGFLFLAALSALVGIIVTSSGGHPYSIFYGLVATTVLVVLYEATRTRGAIIASPSAEIRLNVRSMKVEAVLSLIDKVEVAATEARALRLSPAPRVTAPLLD